MKVVSVLGRKGGQGKTLVSHFLSLGLGRLGHDVVMFQTDVRAARPQEYVENRPYWLAGINGDPSQDVNLVRDVYLRTSKIANSILVVDGGANRRNLDLFIAETSHLVFIPVGFGGEDISVGIRDYEELSSHLESKGSPTEVYFILNRWPGDTRKNETIMRRKWVADFLNTWSHRQLPIGIPDMTSLMDISSDDAPYPVQAAHFKRANDIAALIALKLGLDDPKAMRIAAE